MSKVLQVFMDVDKTIGNDFKTGLAISKLIEV